MEQLVIAVIVVVAFAAVLFPLMRRGPAGEDAREFGAGDSVPDTRSVDPASGAGVVPPMASGPGTPVAAGAAAEHAAAQSPPALPRDGDMLEAEVLRYREALRAGTICGKCGQANPVDSTFCFECGKSLPRADAREFE